MPHKAYTAAEISGAQSPPERAEPSSRESATLSSVSFSSVSFSSGSFSSVSLSSADESGQAVLALLEEMAASLQGSHKAVLASDGLGLENCTREQVRLHRALEMLLRPLAWPGTAIQTEAQQDVQKTSRPAGLRCAPPLAAQLLAAEWRVLRATRVQAALLRRARQLQRILSNLAAAQGLPCGAWFGQSPQF
jgi:hypothetical protein